MPKPYVFLSYFREDRSDIQAILDQLEDRGLAYFIDEWEAENRRRLGPAWWMTQIARASAFVVLLCGWYYRTPGSYVHEELRLASEEGRWR